MKDWHKDLTEDAPVGVTRHFLVPESVAQLYLQFGVGKSRCKQDLLTEGHLHDELLDLCAGQMQLVAMQQERLQALAGLLKDWELIVGEHTEISRRTQTILNDVEGLMSAQFDLGVKEGKSIAPKKGAEKKHQKNRAIKADVFAWLDSNMSRFKSMDQAAEAIAGKVAHIAFRTARAWVGEWKKLRSASKA